MDEPRQASEDTGSQPPTPGPRERARPTWCEQLTWSGLGGQVGAQAAGGAGVGAEPAAVEQSLQRVLLRGPRLAAEAGAAALGVDAARVPFAQRASQAAAAAGFSHQLRARGGGGRRRALGQRTRVARFAAHHGARAHRARAGPRHRRPAEQSECGERSGPERGARGMHGARRAEGLRIGGGERSGARGTRLRDVGKRAAGLQRPAAALARIWAAWESRQIYRSRGVEGHAPERRGWGWGGVGWRRLGSGARASPGSGTKDGGALRASSLGTCSVCARPVLDPPLRPREPWALPATLLPLEP